ncbi:MAG TPA: CheR family methyltransferase, partial [Vicinamibacterales bacterium]|nr:CheR family methyltransferase [Vicinamibacterales bacterium]
VVILHLSPDHDSRLAEVLQSSAPMPVAQVTGTTPIVVDHVYVVPPNRRLGVVDGMLTVSEFTRREQRLAPVDAFFRVLADTHGSRSACVILSGTGPNGSAGLKRIKEYGGLVVAQDPVEAEYGDMPRNAIATGLVDLVLPVADMPAKIRAYIDGAGYEDERVPAAPIAEDPDSVRDVLSVLRLRTGHDFSNYKTPTLQRRIERRMMLRGIPNVAAYARLVRQEPDEAVSLMKELLISVTNFFRDPHAWTAVQERVIPRLFLNKSSQDQVRVWVPGCATGEEAYSVAMLLEEHASRMTDPPAMQVFATDLDQAAIQRAREGLYLEAEIADVSEERLQRFFHVDGRGYRVRRDLRELVLFALHNLIKDPPFSHLDLICCRNVLIYLNRAIQERVAETFHFALRPGGYVFVGNSEAPDSPNDLFLRFDGDAHIYEARSVTSRIVLPRAEVTTIAGEVYQPPFVETRQAERIAPADLHLRLLEQYSPPSVIVNEEHNVVHMSDRIGRYLHVRGGEPTRDLFLLALPDLRPDLRSALHQAARDRTIVDVRGVHVAFEDGVRQVDIRVRPVIREGDPARGFFVVLFEEHRGAEEQAATLTSPAEPVAQQLEDELSRVKAQLRTTIEQYETQAEESKASNEELQAMNEELRSAAEELETSKEELQSVNEELSTLNQELKIKIDELGLTNNDFQNFINSTDIGTIFLDRGLHVKFSTARAREVFNLLESDTGRPLSDITSTIRDADIHRDVRAVLDRLSNIEREVQSENGRWHLMRMLPYRTNDNRIDGVVVTFQDITERRTAETRVRQADERLRLLIDGALEYAIFTMDEKGIVNSWNSGAQRMFGHTAEEIVGADFSALFTLEDRQRGVPARELEEAGRSGRAMDERYHLRKDGTRIYCSGVTRRLGGGGIGFAKIARDLTLQRESAVALQSAHDTLETRVGERTAQLAGELRAHDVAKSVMTNLAHQLVTSQEDERRRIARDLHDNMGQRLTAIRLMLERAKQSAHASDGGTGEIDQALELTAQIGSDVNFLAWQLRPAVLDEFGLAAALPRYIAEWSAHVGIAAEFRLAGYEKGQLPADAETAFYRVAQEALNNVAKHAHATRVDVVLSANDGHIVLVVEDDGVGFDAPEETPDGAFGLLGMRERAALADAALQIESSSGRGTSVFLRRAIKRA